MALATLAALALPSLAACGGGTVPRPSFVQVRAEDYVAVPFGPRPPPVEIVPPRPTIAGELAWADGGWEWSGDRYRWEPGAWVAPKPGVKRARWVIVRRVEDGQLFFAPSSWRDPSGVAVEPPTPLGRAITNRGAPGAGAGEVTAPTVPGGSRTDMDE